MDQRQLQITNRWNPSQESAIPPSSKPKHSNSSPPASPSAKLLKSSASAAIYFTIGKATRRARSSGVKAREPEARGPQWTSCMLCNAKTSFLKWKTIFKKSSSHPRHQNSSELRQMITDFHTTTGHGIRQICTALSVPRSSCSPHRQPAHRRPPRRLSSPRSSRATAATTATAESTPSSWIKTSPVRQTESAES